MRKRYVVVLPEAERALLHTLIGQGTASARALTHARILLKASQGEAGPGWTDQAIAAALEVHPPLWPGPGAVRHRRAGRRGLPQDPRARVPPHPGRRAGGPPGRPGL